jgi:cysteine synthase/rhodanese-related sulfurtransferase
MLYTHISQLIGNTPILKLPQELHGLENIELYAKLELFNPFGSLKDRIAWDLIKSDIQDLQAKKKTVIESSSGNTAKGLQVLTSVLGIDFEIVTNRIKIPEVKAILQILGTKIEELPGLSECPDPTDPNDPIMIIHNKIAQNSTQYFHTSQYTNPKNPQAHYETTGKEIQDDIGNVDFIIGSLGTTGSTKGTATYLQEHNPNLRKIGVIAAKGDSIPGIRNIDEMYEVGIFEKDFYDKIMVVDSIRAIDGTLTLIQKAGILGGPTSGATFLGALDYLKTVDASCTEKKKAVFIVCDRLEWYISYFQKRRPDIFQLQSKKDSIKTLTSEEIENAPAIRLEDAQNWIFDTHPLIIDLRGGIAFKTNHIQGSINILGSQFEELIESGVPFSNEQNVLLVCPIGENSKKCAALLKKKGFHSVWSLEEGVVGWRDRGYPFERSNFKT